VQRATACAGGGAILRWIAPLFVCLGPAQNRL